MRGRDGATGPLHYDYTLAQAYCVERGLEWDAEAVGPADVAFHKAGLDQRQVDVAMFCHVDAVRRAFDPARYGARKRCLIALWFTAPWLLRGFAWAWRQVRLCR